MGRYLIRRVLFMVLVLFIVSLLTFLIFVKLPAGDPARRAVGRATTPQQIEAARKAFGLDKPLWVQYGRFAKGLVPSPGLVPGREGLLLVRELRPGEGGAVPAACRSRSRSRSGAAVIWLADRHPDRHPLGAQARVVLDRAGMLFALIGVSMPVFWLGQLLLYVFWFKLQLAP